MGGCEQFYVVSYPCDTPVKRFVAQICCFTLKCISYALTVDSFAGLLVSVLLQLHRELEDKVRTMQQLSVKYL